MNYEQLKGSVADGAALRLRQRLQPVGGAGDIVFPRSYPGKGHHEQALHVKANEHSLIQFNRQARRFSTGLFFLSETRSIAVPNYHLPGCDLSCPVTDRA